MSNLIDRLKTEWTPIFGGCDGTMFEAASYIDKLERKNKKLEMALKEIAEKDPRTSYATYQNMAKQALGDANV